MGGNLGHFGQKYDWIANIPNAGILGVLGTRVEVDVLDLITEADMVTCKRLTIIIEFFPRDFRWARGGESGSSSQDLSKPTALRRPVYDNTSMPLALMADNHAHPIHPLSITAIIARFEPH
jgi:hypothetical protein